MCVMAFITKSHTSSWQEETLIKKWQMEGVILPEEGLLLRGEGGAKVKSGWIGGLPLWGGEPNAGKCWRFSSPICTSGSGEWKCKNYGPQFQNMKYIKSNFQVYLHLPCFLFSSISIRFSLRFSSLTFFCLRRFLFSKSSKGLKDNLFHLRNLHSKTLKKRFKCSNLQTCPEFPGTGLVVAVPAHRCWTRMWVADEPDSDAGGGSPARRGINKLNVSTSIKTTLINNVTVCCFFVCWPLWLSAPLSPPLWRWWIQDWPPSCRIHVAGSARSRDAGTSAGSRQLDGEKGKAGKK